MKIARFANAARKVEKKLKKARASEKAASHSGHNEKLVRRKLQRQVQQLKEELAKQRAMQDKHNHKALEKLRTMERRKSISVDDAENARRAHRSAEDKLRRALQDLQRHKTQLNLMKRQMSKGDKGEDKEALKAEMLAHEQQWKTKYSSMNNMLEEANKEKRSLALLRDKWKTAAVKATSQEITKAREDLAAHKEELAEAREEALE